MRIPETCEHCSGRLLTYATVTSDVFRTRYKKCESCTRTAKTITAIPSEIFLSGNDFPQLIGHPATITANG
jgi:hypothetical protein